MSRAEHEKKTMFAVIKTGGKQYTVAADKRITVMALPGEAGARVVFDEVLALFDGDSNQVGAPRVAGASVVGEIVEQTRGPKVIAFKKRRRKNSKRKRGHRQDLTIVQGRPLLGEFLPLRGLTGNGGFGSSAALPRNRRSEAKSQDLNHRIFGSGTGRLSKVSPQSAIP
jgi:large subunit ribosomal protein L21